MMAAMHSALTKTPEDVRAIDDDGQAAVLELLALIQGHWAAGVVGTLARLGVVDRLGSGSKGSDELAAATGVEPATMARLLRAAAFLGVLHQPSRDRFAATPVADRLRSDERGFRELAIALTEPGVWRAWERLPEAIAGGRSTAAGQIGGTLWEHFERHPEEADRFAAAMGSMSARHTESVLAAVDPYRFRRIIDVGGSHGELLLGLLGAAPDASGVLFDLPDTLEGTREEIARSAVGGRIELVGGDFFDEVPADGDLYILKGVLLDWDDEEAARILSNCHAAAAPGATIWVVEALLPEPPATSWVNLLDINMLVLFGGRDRTLAEYQTLLNEAGFEPGEVTELVDDHALIEAVRR